MPGYGKQIAIGVIVLIAVFATAGLVGVLFPQRQVAAVVFAGVLIAPILGGFLIPVQRYTALYVPPFRGSGGVLMPNLQAQPYPQVCAFHTGVRNLWLLLIPAMLAIVVSGLIFTSSQDQPADTGGGGFEWVGGIWWLVPVLFWGAAMLATEWVRERWLLLKGVARLGVLVSGAGRELSYWFYDEKGDRLGGIAPHHAGVTIVSPYIPIFCNPKKSERHRAGFAFLFHRFVVVDSKHLPRELLTKTLAQGR